jgi:hypothetical protein
VTNNVLFVPKIVSAHPIGKPELRLPEGHISEQFSSKRFFSQYSDNDRTIPRAATAEAV